MRKKFDEAFKAKIALEADDPGRIGREVRGSPEPDQCLEEADDREFLGPVRTEELEG